MEVEDKQSTRPMPVLSRLDRLDLLLGYLEERHSLSQRHNGNVSEPSRLKLECKPLASALQEVQSKGTLMDRIAVLENRVLQLSLEMEEGSASSSSTLAASNAELSICQGADPTSNFASSNELQKEPAKHREEVSKGFHEDQDHDRTHIEVTIKQEQKNQKPKVSKKSNRGKKRALKTLRNRKWMEWFMIGC
ncbi:hypothetical protein AMTRI_Chr03g43920 [Amborella trichopoda]